MAEFGFKHAQAYHLLVLRSSIVETQIQFRDLQCRDYTFGYPVCAYGSSRRCDNQLIVPGFYCDQLGYARFQEVLFYEASSNWGYLLYKSLPTL